MKSSANQKALVAVDLGAQSCRVSLLRWGGREPEIEIIHRFSNAPVSANNGLHWDIETILDGVMFGLRSCAAHAPEGIASVAIDGWAVDYVRLDEGGNPVAPPFCYRDARTEEAEKEVHAILSASRLYLVERNSNPAIKYSLPIICRQTRRLRSALTMGEFA